MRLGCRLREEEIEQMHGARGRARIGVMWSKLQEKWYDLLNWNHFHRDILRSIFFSGLLPRADI